MRRAAPRRVRWPRRRRRRCRADHSAAGAGTERLSDVSAGRVVVAIVDDRSSVCHGESSCVEADAPGAAAEDQDASTRARVKRVDDGAPGVREIVARRRHSGGRDAVGDGNEHVAGERHSEQVADHAAPRAGRRAEAVGGELAVRRCAALRRKPRLTAVAPTARDRPRNHDGLSDAEFAHVIADCDDLGDAFVADRERSAEWHLTADARHNGVDGPQRDPDLHGPRHGAMQWNGVAVATAGDERPHDRVGGSGQSRFWPVLPSQRTARLNCSSRMVPQTPA